MSLKRLALLGSLTAGTALLVGLQANASGSAVVLNFSNAAPHVVGIGLDTTAKGL